MSKKKTKELIICVITVGILLLTLVTDVFATGNIDELLNDINNTTFNTIPEDNNTVNNATVNNATVNNTTNSIANNKTNTNNTTTMPNTGVDYSVIFIIAICGVSAIYAYKKIRDYNNF